MGLLLPEALIDRRPMSDADRSCSFPDNFFWGAAAAAYQIEGAVSADGRGESIWDLFCREPGRVWRDHSGRHACDHFHRYREDVALMSELELQAYRLSVSWSRVLPNGTEQVNEAGLDFYDRLIDELLEAKITPYITLYHWDLPAELYYRGGFLNRDCSQWFAEFATLMAGRLGDRVNDWFTLNEPQVFIGAGLERGIHAPGLKLNHPEVLRAGHHCMMAHGRAVQAIRASSKCPARVGYAPVGIPKIPHTTNPADVVAAKERMFTLDTRNCWNNAWWMDPVLLGHYPESGMSIYGTDMPKFPAADLDVICQPLDYLGVNIYQGQRTRVGEDGPEEVPISVGAPITAFDWPVTPEALYWGPRFLHERYGLPMVITENGLSCRDWVSTDGRVHDPNRIDFAKRYLRELRRAVAEGIPVLGYFHWSIMDNFEWCEGYKHRFGMVFVDYETQQRTIKDSALWYREVIRSGGKTLSHD